MNIKDYFSKYFNDSYGWDKFSTFIGIFGIIALISSGWTKLIGIALILYALWRCFSKNKYKRHLEDEAFNQFLSSFVFNIRSLKGKVTDWFNYKVFACPYCSQKLRVPRHKGKIIVVCKKCHKEFKAKS